MTSLAEALLPRQGRMKLADAAALSALVQESVASNAPRQALLVRLALLAPRLREEHHQRLLRETLEPLLRPSRARLFTLPNGDLVAVGPERGWHMENVAQRLITLLGAEAAGEGASLLRLPDQATIVLAALEEALAEDPPPLMHVLPPRPAVEGDGAPDPTRLAQALGGANLSAFLRCRPVLRVAPEAEAEASAQWTEWQVDVPELSAILLGERAAAASPALTPHLRGVLDGRLLAELARPEEATQRGPIGLSLGLAALDSAAFRKLDSLVAPEVRARSVIGLPAAAVLADPVGFRAAREVLADRGWRLALDAADPAVLALLPPRRCGVALVRLRFDHSLPARGLPPSLPPASVVLTGVDRAVALGWGLDAGIRLFEGRLLRG
ncbi:MAG: hypothetical protein K2X49_20425 [Acetobacteraceae bacterium]|nr:hypothetical protein [Acetobacteraceae bacterium]